MIHGLDNYSVPPQFQDLPALIPLEFRERGALSIGERMVELATRYLSWPCNAVGVVFPKRPGETYQLVVLEVREGNRTFLSSAMGWLKVASYATIVFPLLAHLFLLLYGSAFRLNITSPQLKQMIGEKRAYDSVRIIERSDCEALWKVNAGEESNWDCALQNGELTVAAALIDKLPPDFPLDLRLKIWKDAFSLWYSNERRIGVYTMFSSLLKQPQLIACCDLFLVEAIEKSDLYLTGEMLEEMPPHQVWKPQQSPWECAVRRQCVLSASSLIRRIPPNLPYEQGLKAWRSILEKDYERCPISQRIKHVSYFQRYVFPKLIERLDSQVLSSQDERGNTLLHHLSLALSTDYQKEELLEKIARPLVQKLSPEEASLQDNQGKTALHSALVAGSLQLALLLIETLPPQFLSLRDNEGRTPLNEAIRLGLLDIVKALLRKLDQGHVFIPGIDPYNPLREAIYLDEPGERRQITLALMKKCGLSSLHYYRYDALMARKEELAQLLSEKAIQALFALGCVDRVGPAQPIQRSFALQQKRYEPRLVDLIFTFY